MRKLEGEAHMNKTKILALSVVLCFSVYADGLSSKFEELLTPDDVEKIIGIQGLKLIPRDPVIGAGGDLNFAKDGNDLVLIVSIQNASMYTQWKNEEGFFHADVSGIGDEAFEGPDFGEYRYILIFRKGKNAVSMSSFIDMDAGGKPYLNQDQLQELAKIMTSRL